jgi:D-tyrosyl-tRNA(Tyr) deacylase
MRAVVQRVKEAWIEVKGARVGSIGKGLLVYLGVQESDEQADLDYICEKIVGMRIFEDNKGKMNVALEEAGGSILLVSQFTLYGDCRKGRRPSFSDAALPGKARILYELAAVSLKKRGIVVETGMFREMMDVYSLNDGPVTFLLDSRKAF